MFICIGKDVTYDGVNNSCFSNTSEQPWIKKKKKIRTTALIHESTFNRDHACIVHEIILILQGMTPLMHACIGPIATFEGSLGDRTSTIWYLLDQGADIAIRNKIGETALHVAIRKGLCHCVCMCGCVLFVTEFLKKCVINVQLHSSWICQLFGQEDAKASFSFVVLLFS
jgi:ankyrin repeat protein